MFRIGDYVAHYKEGVCEVVNIGKIDMGSSDKEYYTLKPVYDAAFRLAAARQSTFPKGTA